MLEHEAMIGGGSGVVVPLKGPAEMHQLGMQALEPMGLGHRPCPYPWNMKEGKQPLLGGLDASGMQCQTVACIVVEEDGKTQIGVQEADETIERKVQVRRNLCSGLMQALEGLLAMKFVGMNDDHVERRPALKSV